jgi:3-oxoadipate enol-lactonase
MPFPRARGGCSDAAFHARVWTFSGKRGKAVNETEAGAAHARTGGLHIERSGAGTPFVWGHGLLSGIAAEDAQGWLDWQNLPAGIELIRYDARGHGKSAPAPQADAYAWPALAQDLLAVAEHCGAARFIAGGASMGCAAALCAALQAPERVRALVLVAPPTVWEGRARQRKLYRRGALLGSLLSWRLAAQPAAQAQHGGPPAWMAGDGRQRALALGVAELPQQTMAALFQGAGLSDLPPREAFAALAQLPTLIVGWTGDPTHPDASARALHALLPASTVFIAADSAAFGSIPERIRQFLASQAG